MRLQFIKIISSISLLFLALFVFPNPAFAGIGKVTGNVQVRDTNAPIAGIWVKWESNFREDLNTLWPHENTSFKYVKTDQNGNYVFPNWGSISGSEIFDKQNSDYRALQYLTWIKPDQPEVTPDSSAYYNIYLPAMNGQDYREPKNIIAAVQNASSYKPAGEGWVRTASTAHSNGGFQCDNTPHTISAISPRIWDGTFQNNAQQLRTDEHNVNNAGGDVDPLGTIIFAPNNPTNFNPIPTSTPIQTSTPSLQPGASINPNTSPQPTVPGSVQNPTSSNISPSVDIWAASGVNVTGKNTPGGTLRVDPSQPFTLFWTAANASTCVASGNWAGIKRAGATAQSKLINQTEPLTTYTYTLTCFNNESGNQESDTVLVQIAASDVDPFLQTTEGDVHSNQDISVPK